MQHQPHEAFFSFTVPPKPSFDQHQHSSPAVPLQTHQLPHRYHPHQSNSHLLSSIVTDLDPSSTSHIELSRSPCSVSPSGPGSLNRPSTAGPFAFSVPPPPPSAHSSATPCSTTTTTTRLSPTHPSTSASSVTTSIDRPFSSSGRSIPGSLSTSFNHHAQTPSSSHATSTHSLSFQQDGPSTFAHLASGQSNLPAHLHLPNYDLNSQHTRPMTAPGPSWVGGHQIGEALDFPSAHLDPLGQTSSLPSHPNGLTAPALSKTTSEIASSTSHISRTSPGSSHLVAGTVDPIGLVHRSPSGPSDPESSIQGPHSISSLDRSDQIISSTRGPGLGRTSLETRSSESTPESSGSPDTDRPQLQSYLHSMPSDPLHHVLRPNTHSGTSTPFGFGDRFLSHPFNPRPATGYPHLYDSSTGFAPLQPHVIQYVPRPSTFNGHSSQIYGPTSAHYSHGPGLVDCNGSDRLYNFNILPGAPRKRARRRFDEVERLYDCNYPGCTKAYGTLNHLNAHITMQKHGAKRLPQEFKEIRKEWRARKKAEAESRAAILTQNAAHLASSHEYNVMNGQDQMRNHTSSMSGGNSPTQDNNAFHGRPANLGSYSAPAQSQQFVVSDRPTNWYNNDHRIHRTTIDEEPHYIGSGSNHELQAPLLATHEILGPSTTVGTSNSCDVRPLDAPNQDISPPALNHSNLRTNPIVLNHSSPSIVD